MLIQLRSMWKKSDLVRIVLIEVVASHLNSQLGCRHTEKVKLIKLGWDILRWREIKLGGDKLHERAQIAKRTEDKVENDFSPVAAMSGSDDLVRPNDGSAAHEAATDSTGQHDLHANCQNVTTFYIYIHVWFSSGQKLKKIAPYFCP